MTSSVDSRCNPISMTNLTGMHAHTCVVRFTFMWGPRVLTIRLLDLRREFCSNRVCPIWDRTSFSEWHYYLHYKALFPYLDAIL